MVRLLPSRDDAAGGSSGRCLGIQKIAGTTNNGTRQTGGGQYDTNTTDSERSQQQAGDRKSADNFHGELPKKWERHQSPRDKGGPKGYRQHMLSMVAG